jgi:hypothetical protein
VAFSSDNSAHGSAHLCIQLLLCTALHCISFLTGKEQTLNFWVRPDGAILHKILFFNEADFHFSWNCEQTKCLILGYVTSILVL